MIQAVSFDKLYWNTSQAREYLNKNVYNPIKRVHTTDKYHRNRLIEPDYNKYHYIMKRGNNHIDYIIQIKKQVYIIMKNKITERTCKDCDTVISYIPRKVRCANFHQKYIDNAMITSKKDDDFTKGKRYELMKQAINKLENRDVSSIIDSIIDK